MSKKTPNVLPQRFSAKRLSRVCVVDHQKNGAGRLLDMWQVSVRFSLQDDGRTLKIFLTDKNPV
jgi:hypothetical protein